MAKSGTVRRSMKRASDSRTVRGFARVGLAASGIVHILIGALALLVAIGFDSEANQSGAFTVIAETPGGVFVLWIAAAALFGLGLWQSTGPRALTTDPDEGDDTKEKAQIWWLRIRNIGKAIAFIGVGFAALAFAIGARSDGAESTQSMSARLIEFPGGVFVLAAIGVVVASVGGVFVFRGVSRNFREDIDPPKGMQDRIVVTLGIIGYTCKGLTFVAVGLLFVGGAFFTDSSWSTGIDGAAHFLVGLPGGVWVLGALAAGFMVHGLYMIARGIYLRR